MMKMMSKGKGWFAKLVEVYKEGRRHARLPADYTATLAGPFGTIHVTGVDLTRDGAGVLSPHSLPPGALVFLRIAELGLMGFGNVRHCSERGGGYFLGLKFREGLSRERADGDWQYQRRAQSAYRAWDEAES